MQSLQKMADDFRVLERDVEDLKKPIPATTAAQTRPTAVAPAAMTLPTLHGGGPGGGPGGEGIALRAAPERGGVTPIAARSHKGADNPTTRGRLHHHLQEGT